MNLIVFHKKSCTGDKSNSLLQAVLSDSFLSSVICGGLGKSLSRGSGKSAGYLHRNSIVNGTLFAIPQDLRTEPRLIESGSNMSQYPGFKANNEIIFYENDIPFDRFFNGDGRYNSDRLCWLAISNGRFATRINPVLIKGILDKAETDIVSVNAISDLMNQREKILLTTDNKIAGFRRHYSDFAELVSGHNDWPCHLFIRSNVIKKVAGDGHLLKTFNEFADRCRSMALTIKVINVGGLVFDLQTERGLLEFCRLCLNETGSTARNKRRNNSIAQNAVFLGNIMLGNNINIESDVIVTGPAIIGDNVHLGKGTIVHSSVIASGSKLVDNQFVNNCIVSQKDSDLDHDTDNTKSHTVKYTISGSSYIQSETGDTNFRSWPKFSYPRFIKRIADIIAALMVILLFAPLGVLIAVAIKLTSPGPVFFGHLRQGLHGKNFHCLKFRTMITGADKIQDKLRFGSHVDGPQFKMENDPRISVIGKFLRDTYIDEIPQFLNVLLGQMSVVGPRPSPESENTMCPSWRDARLSIRPGITGLWQISRTREPMKDFQEWIYYDTEYVRNLSLKMDLMICWRTFKKLLSEFMNKF